jgi:hypothetical protein
MNIDPFQSEIKFGTGYSFEYGPICKSTQEDSFYSISNNQKKDNKDADKIEIYVQKAENHVSKWIAQSQNKKHFTDLEQIEITEKLKLPYESKNVFTRWKHSYPNSNIIKSKTIYIKCDNSLSSISKIMLTNFQNKYFYHIIDDIIYSLKSNSIERDNLLSIIYEPVLYLQNNFYVDFFDIWIGEIYIDQESKINKFLDKNILNLQPFSYLTINFLYTTKLPGKKLEPLW